MATKKNAPAPKVWFVGAGPGDPGLSRSGDRTW